MNRVALNFWPVEVVIPLRLAAFMPFAKIRHIMVRTEVISVNPGNTAEGARFVNVSARCAARIARRPVLSVRKSFPVLNFLFPTQNAGLRLSVTLLVLRIIVGGLLIYAGIAGLAYSGMAYNVALGNLVVGAMIAIGLLFARYVFSGSILRIYGYRVYCIRGGPAVADVLGSVIVALFVRPRKGQY